MKEREMMKGKRKGGREPSKSKQKASQYLVTGPNQSPKRLIVCK